jgi:hypothetical protein
MPKAYTKNRLCSSFVLYFSTLPACKALNKAFPLNKKPSLAAPVTGMAG